MPALSRDVLTDFGLVSIVIVVSHLLRSRLKVLQDIYVPSTIIAGLICLLGGWQFLDIIPFSPSDSGVPNIVSYPSYLVVLLFSTLFMGKRKKKVSIKSLIEHSGDTFFYNLASLVGQYGFSILFGMTILYFLFPNLPEGFAVMLPAGFVGGHGTATAFGQVMEHQGLVGALSVANASATVGILVAIFGGILLVNVGTRLGYTRIVRDTSQMPMSMKTGFVPEKERAVLGHETVSPIALDPLTWHIALVLAVATVAFYVSQLITSFFSGGIGLPVFCIALLLGGILQKALDFMGVGQYVDRHTIHRIGSWVTDYLVAFGIASITMNVVLNYMLPLCTLFMFGVVFNLVLMWFLGQRMFRDLWFERSLFTYGWGTGSVATAVVLNRILDPDMKTPIVEEFGLAYILISFFEIAIVAVLPPLAVSGMLTVPMIILLSIFVACLILSRYFVGWFKYAPSAIRPGEERMAESLSSDE